MFIMKNDKVRILVTGGSGFIGSEVIAQLLKKGATLANLDIKPPTRPEHQPFWRACDVRDADKVRELTTAFDPHYVLHLASDIEVTLPRIEDYQTTIEGTRNVVAAAQALPHLRRFIHTSTQFVVTPGVQPKGETDFHPHTLYGEAKVHSEEIVRASTLKDWVIMRPAIIWGPYHPILCNAMWKYIANRRYLHPASKQPILKCYGYVRNTAEQMIAFIDADLSKTSQRVFYLGDGSIDQDLWADGFARAFTGKPAKRVPKALLWLLGQAGEMLRPLGIRFPMNMGRYFRMTTSAKVDMEPTFAIAGRPSVSLEQGIKETVAWLEKARPDLLAARQPAQMQSTVAP